MKKGAQGGEKTRIERKRGRGHKKARVEVVSKLVMGP